MRIGIITFHWATNYGAILQAYALQTYLESVGHEVTIINYKPKQYDFSLYNFIKIKNLIRMFIYPKRINKYIQDKNKEAELQLFRQKRLNLSSRYYSLSELKANSPKCDVYITGSDQILNPSFLLHGEKKNKKSTTYYLDFGGETIKRIGYAVSFGCDVYPQIAKQIAEPLLCSFSKISTREATGIDILNSMNFKNSLVVPDPTLLLYGSDYISNLNIGNIKHDYNFVYMLRDDLSSVLNKYVTKLKYSDNKNESSIERWLDNIKNSQCVITNSYHGMIFCLQFHTQFVVVLKKDNSMNNRFYTLLNKLDLMDRVCYYNEIHMIDTIIRKTINWDRMDSQLDEYRTIGKLFLKDI